MIWLLIIVQAIALIGLTLVQFYWINNAIELKEQQVKQLLGRVMGRISHVLEQHETFFRILGEMEGVNPDSIIGKEGMSFYMSEQGLEWTEGDSGIQYYAYNNQVTPLNSEQLNDLTTDSLHTGVKNMSIRDSSGIKLRINTHDLKKGLEQNPMIQQKVFYNMVNQLFLTICQSKKG